MSVAHDRSQCQSQNQKSSRSTRNSDGQEEVTKLETNAITLKDDGKYFCLLVEYGKYCCLVLLSCMSSRRIVRRLSLKQLSLGSVPSSFTVNLEIVKAGIGQTYGQVEVDKWKYRYLYVQEVQLEVQQEVQREV